jgi:hypothetical protein
VLPAAATVAAQAAVVLGSLLPRAIAWIPALALIAAAAVTAPARSLDRRRNPPLALDYVAGQGRWFRAKADELRLTHPRVAHFDIGGVSLESGAEVIDLAGLADLYIGRVGYQAHDLVREYVFRHVRPEMINVHGPCQYLRDDPRMERDYLQAASGIWGENWVRRDVAGRRDDRCPHGDASLLPPADELPARLAGATPRAARDLWLCARAHLNTLPDVRPVAARLTRDGLAERDPQRAMEMLDAAVTLDPDRVRAARRLLELRLAAAVPSSR